MATASRGQEGTIKSTLSLTSTLSRVVFTLSVPSPQRHHSMTSQGTAHGRFQRAIHRRHVQAAEMAAREMGGLSLRRRARAVRAPANEL